MMILVSGNSKQTGQLDASWPGHLGHLLTAKNGNSIQAVLATGLKWGCDNGAFSGFDPAAFRRLLRRVSGRPRLLWVVCPDRVADASGTLALWRVWEPELRAAGVPVAFVLQDGQEAMPLPKADAYFVGGSTRFKLSEAAADLIAEGKRREAWVHMGRVNSMRRLEHAFRLGCDSVDGSSYSRWHHRTITDRRDMGLERHLRFLRSLDTQGAFW